MAIRAIPQISLSEIMGAVKELAKEGSLKKCSQAAQNALRFTSQAIHQWGSFRWAHDATAKEAVQFLDAAHVCFKSHPSTSKLFNLIFAVQNLVIQNFSKEDREIARAQITEDEELARQPLNGDREHDGPILTARLNRLF